MLDTETYMVKDYLDDKDKYISLINEPLRGKAQRIYEQLMSLKNEYLLTLYDSVTALTIQGKALDAKKIDPAIAGGLAQGAFGIGAGIYAAGSSAVRNQQIDESRKAAEKGVSDAQLSKSVAESRLLAKTKELHEIIQQSPQAVKYRENKKELLYLQSVKKIKSNKKEDIDEAKKNFKMLADYKDSMEMIALADTKKKDNKQAKAVVYSILWAVAITLFLGFSGGFDNLLMMSVVPTITFIVSFVWMQYFVKK